MCHDENDLMQRIEIERSSQYTGGKNNFNAPRCIFSLNGIGSSNGKIQGYLVKLQEKIEYAYLCGDNIPVESFVISQQHRCEEYVRSQYYNPVTGL